MFDDVPRGRRPLSAVPPHPWERDQPSHVPSRSVVDTTHQVGRRLEKLRPGPELAELLGTLSIENLSGYDLVSYLGACERQTAWAQSRQLTALRELARRRPAARRPGVADADEPGGRSALAQVSEFAADEVACELRISRRAAENRLALAVALEDLPGTAAAMDEGRLNLAKVTSVANAAMTLEPGAGQALERRVLDRAPEQTVAGLRESLRRAALSIDPRAAQVRHERARRERGVEFVPLDDGMAGIWATMAAQQARAYFEGITALAEKAKAAGDDRTLAQRRADVMADLGGQLLDRGDLPRRHGRRPHLQVTVAATTLLGINDAPGQLAGYGPITAEVARELSGDATWRRILTDPVSGVLVDYGTTVYEPPQGLTDKLIAKHQHCRGVGCRMPADRCELDHTIEFPTGPTSERNLGPVCKHDHRRKHEGGWACAQAEDGTYTWVTPTGHVYTDPLEPVLERDPDPPPTPTQTSTPPLEPPPF